MEDIRKSVYDAGRGLGVWIAVSAALHAALLFAWFGRVCVSFDKGESCVEVLLADSGVSDMMKDKAERAEALNPKRLAFENEDIAAPHISLDSVPPGMTFSRPPLSPPSSNRMLSKGAVKTPSARSSISPEYPWRSRVRGEEGIVKVLVVVSPQGKALMAKVVGSSGYELLDRSAVNAASGASYAPARFMGIPVQSDKLLEFVFRLVESRGRGLPG